MKRIHKLLQRLGVKRRLPSRKSLRASQEHASQSRFRRVLPKLALLIVTIVALSGLMSVHLLPDKISLRLGDVSGREIRAARSVRYFDSVQTLNSQQSAARNTRPVYDNDETAIAEANRAVTDFYARIETARATLTGLALPQAIAQEAARLQPEFGSTLSKAQLERLLSVSPLVFQKIRSVTTRMVEDSMEREIRDFNEEMRPANDQLVLVHYMEEVARTALPSKQDAAIALAIAEQAIRPNRLLNRAKTRSLRDSALRKIEPVYGVLNISDKVIGANETVTQEHIDKFTALGLLNPRLEWTTALAIFLLSAGMAALVVFYIARALPNLYADTRRLALLSVIVLLGVFGLKFGASMLGLQFSSGQLGYLGMMSVAAAGMLVCMLLDRNLAVMIVALLAVLSGLIMNHEIRFTVMTLLSSLVGISSIGGTRRRLNPLISTAALALTNVALVWILGLLFNDALRELLTGTGWAVASALFATFLFWLGALILEKPFGILTHATLLELSAFDRPLLQQLCAVAPGTYAHSMMVGALSEAGAQAVGADGLLARVGGYYHDIGKMKRPDFFVENQRRDNVHGRLSPSLSALIITAHVRDGVEMAQENRLPAEIRDIIAQHHGTTLIRYFYHQALADWDNTQEAPIGLEAKFRYPGPKPQNREAAVVMLADTVEAATRALEKPNAEQVRALIDKLVRDKIEDGQLDECDLSFNDIKRICDAFEHVLTAMMHGRIDYPDTPRTATGRPMEVVRADLRPELLARPTALTGSPHDLAADLGVSELTDSGEVTAHLAVEAALGIVPPLAFTGRDTGQTNVTAALVEENWASSARLPFKAPEELYADSASEGDDATRPDDRPAPSGATPTRRGKLKPRRG